MRTKYVQTLIFLLLCFAIRDTCSASCGGKFTDPEGNITSPNYPDHYPPGAFCFWEIFAPPGDVIVIEFHEFDLELASEGCKYDYVIVIDGNTELRYCGSDIPKTITSHGYKVTIGFVTDENSQHKGFLASYKTVNPITTTTTESSTTAALHTGCGGNIYDSGATILSPGYPDPYPPDVVCIWNIQPRYETDVYMTIDSLDIDDTNQCSDDYLEMFDVDLKVLGRFCGDVAPPVIIRSKKRMTVVFKSDDQVSKRGFKLSYRNEEPKVYRNVSETFPPTNKPPLTNTRPRSNGNTTTSSTPTSYANTGGSDNVSGSEDILTTVKFVEPGSSNSGKVIGIGVGSVLFVVVVVVVAVVIYCIRKRKQPNRLLGERRFSSVPPPMTYGSDNYGAKPYHDTDTNSNHGYEAVHDSSNLSDVSTPWGTAKRSQLREISPDYIGTGNTPQLGLRESRIDVERGSSGRTDGRTHQLAKDDSE